MASIRRLLILGVLLGAAVALASAALLLTTGAARAAPLGPFGSVLLLITIILLIAAAPFGVAIGAAAGSRVLKLARSIGREDAPESCGLGPAPGSCAPGPPPDRDWGDHADDASVPAWLLPLARSARRAGRRQRDEARALRERIDWLERRNAETSEECRLRRAALDAVGEAVLVSDSAGRLLLANEAARPLLRIDPAAAGRLSLDRALVDPDVARRLRRAGSPGGRRTPPPSELRLVRADRSIYYRLTHGRLDGDGSRRPAALLSVLRDVSRERRIADLNSDFVSRVSHELRTPLSSIAAYIEMLMDGEVADARTRDEFYGIIDSEARRLGGLIDNMLNISRIESGSARTAPEVVAPRRIVREALGVIGPQAAAKRIRLIDLSTPDNQPALRADRDLLQQALVNLLSNAVKYTPEGGRVTVRTAVDEGGRTVTLSVSDTGVGIPQDAMPHLFEKFFRVADHKKMARGTGLGLNLVRHVVQTVHHGWVTVASRPGAGSTFSIHLPLAIGGRASEPEPTAAAGAIG